MTKEKKAVVPNKLAKNTPAKNTSGKKASPEKDVTPKKVAVKKPAAKKIAKSPAKKLAAKKQLMNPSACEIPEEGMWMDFDENVKPLEPNRRAYRKFIGIENVMPVSWFIADVTDAQKLTAKQQELLDIRTRQAILRTFSGIPITSFPGKFEAELWNPNDAALYLVSIHDGLRIPIEAGQTDSDLNGGFWGLTTGKEFNSFLLQAGYGYQWVEPALSTEELSEEFHENTESFFVEVHWKELEKVFRSTNSAKNNWQQFVLRGDSNGLNKAARVRRSHYHPVRAAVWWFKKKKPEGVTPEQVRTQLAFLLPEDKRQYATAVRQDGSIDI